MPVSSDHRPSPPLLLAPEPVRPVDRQPSNAVQLPRPLTSFIGREREVATVVDRLRRQEIRLLTLTGPGGVGKTRLAIQVAATVAADYPDGVWFVPLAPVRDPGLVASTIARTLGVPETAHRPTEDGIAMFLASRHGLLVLDNFEHVLEAAPLLSALLAACPCMTALVTSRSVLRVSGEHDVAVPPLSLPSQGFDEAKGGGDAAASIVASSEAVRLFVARASAADAGFALDGSNSDDVATLCARLDGLPLAIELAAARIRAFPPAAMLRRLDQRLPLLAGGPRDQPARLRSMRDAIAWSYDLLSPDERGLFRRLAVFVGGATLEAVEAVCAAETMPTERVLEGIAALTDSSLLRQRPGPEQQPRFLMLETIREYGLTQLAASGEEPRVRRAHAEWFVAFAGASWQGLTPRFAPAWLHRLEADHNNLRAALGWLEQTGDGGRMLGLAGSLWWFWHLRNYRREARDWLERAIALTHDTEVPIAVRARALYGAGVLARNQGDYERAFALGTACVACAEQAADRAGLAVGHDLLGQVALARGDYAGAATHHEEALALFTALDTRFEIDSALMQLATAALGQGDYARATALLEETLPSNRAMNNAFGLAYALGYLALAACGQRAYAIAAARFAAALPLWQEAGNRENLAEWLAGVATLAAFAGLPERAGRLFGAADHLRLELGHTFGLPERAWHERGERSARVALGDTAFAAAVAIGRAWPLAEALAAAGVLLREVSGSPAATTHRGPSVPVRTATVHDLTPRQLEVLRLVAAGQSNAQIAAALFISVPTVKRHLTTILAKLDLPSRSAATAYAHTHHLV